MIIEKMLMSIVYYSITIEINRKLLPVFQIGHLNGPFQLGTSLGLGKEQYKPVEYSI